MKRLTKICFATSLAALTACGGEKTKTRTEESKKSKETIAYQKKELDELKNKLKKSSKSSLEKTTSLEKVVKQLKIEMSSDRTNADIQPSLFESDVQSLIAYLQTKNPENFKTQLETVVKTSHEELAQFEKDVLHSTEPLAKFSAQMEEQSRERERIANELKEIESDLLPEIRSNIQKYSERKASLEAELADKIQKDADAAKVVAEADADLNQKKNDMASHKEIKNQRVAEISALEEALSQAVTERYRAKISSEISTLNEVLKNVTDFLTNLEGLKHQASTKALDAKKAREQTYSEVAALNDEITKTGQHLSELHMELTSVVGSGEKNTGRVTQLNETIASIEREINLLVSEVIPQTAARKEAAENKTSAAKENLELAKRYLETYYKIIRPTVSSDANQPNQNAANSGTNDVKPEIN